jgi:hypothetical protein
MKRTNAVPWIVLLVIGALGETIALVLTAIFGISAFGQSDAAERSRMWTSAGWWLLGSLAFTAVSVYSLHRLLRIVALQAPSSATEGSPR